MANGRGLGGGAEGKAAVTVDRARDGPLVMEMSVGVSGIGTNH